MSLVMPTGQQIVELSQTQWGKPYRLGAENKVGPKYYFDADEWDCSEFTEGTFGFFGVYLPDGSGAQGDFLKSHRIPIKDALTIPGAVLGHYPKDGGTGHVIMSRGIGDRSSEARGRKYGVGSWNILNRGLTWAALVPGVNYKGGKIQIPAPPPPSGSQAELMQALFYAKHFRLGSKDPNVLNENSPGAEAAIKFAQTGLNNWWDRIARLTGQPNPEDIPVNGKWDQKTRDSINFMQAVQDKANPGQGYNELGTTGEKFWESTFPTHL